jgi:hypothetical protein
MTNLKSKLLKIQSELKAPKNQFNGFGKYKYRNQEDILESVKPLLLKHGLTLTISDDTHELCGLPVVMASVCVQDDKESLCVTAHAGIDVNKKGMDMSQCFGSSSSYARKYALNGMFLIDDTKDADSEKPSVKEKGKPTLSLASDNYDKVVSYLKTTPNADINLVLDKYVVSAEMKKELIKLTK